MSFVFDLLLSLWLLFFPFQVTPLIFAEHSLEEVEADFRSGASIKNEGFYVDYDENLHSFLEPGAIPEHRARALMLLDLGDLFEKSLRETSAQSS